MAQYLTWATLLEKEKSATYFQNILKSIEEEENQGIVIYPPKNQRFEAFRRTPFESLKCVILGQDPYVNPKQAHGLCFSVPQGVPLPPSLINIFKEIETDLGCKMDYSNGDLSYLADQGVFLLNSILTVRKGAPGSHKHLSWEIFTDKVIQLISHYKEAVVFMLWGSFACKKESLIDKTKHLILKAPHPSPLSCNKGFFGCKHFSQCNDFLASRGLGVINWSNFIEKIVETASPSNS